MTNKFIPAPYKLINKIQHYEWGTKNEKAFIPYLVGEEVQSDLPYAELWIGTHPKASSEVLIENEKIVLNEFINKYPEEILGINVINKFGKNLPFLLKILSAANALSIQTHPNKEQAKKLHSKDAKNYPDDNHKPEIAIAIDSLTAIAGFRPIEEIKKNLQKYPEIFFFAENINNEILETVDETKITENIKTLYSAIMKSSSNSKLLDEVISKILNKISGQKKLSEEEHQFLQQHKLFGNDVGLLSFFFFNLVRLKPGQAIFTDAGIPHAYIEGNIIECMANSDNVVRAGLTNKFKDVDTLLNILTYDFSEYNILNFAQQNNFTYKTSAEEFQVTMFSKSTGEEVNLHSESKVSIILIIEGSAEMFWNKDNESASLGKGDTLLIPASLETYKIQAQSKLKYFIVNVP